MLGSVSTDSTARSHKHTTTYTSQYACTAPQYIKHIEEAIPKQLQSYCLKVNADKTEYLIAPYQSKSNKQTTKSNLEWSELDWVLNQPEEQGTNSTSTIPDWKKCKLLGSMPDTGTDITARKNKTIDIMNLYKHFFTTRRLSNDTKMHIFQTYICSVFMYNSEPRSMTTTLEQHIGGIHRKQLRFALGIYWPRTFSNDKLYEITKAEPWCRVIKRRRLTWIGHLMRLHPETPALLSLKEALRPTKRPIGHPMRSSMGDVVPEE